MQRILGTFIVHKWTKEKLQMDTNYEPTFDMTEGTNKHTNANMTECMNEKDFA